MAQNTIQALQVRTADSAAFDGTFQPLSPGLDEPCYMLRITNDTDKDIFISFDGTTNHDRILAGEKLELAAPANPLYPSHIALFKRDLPVWVMGTSAGTGLVYLAGYYQVSSR